MPWPPPARQPKNILRRLRGAALAAIAVLVAASSLASFGESYHALYLWAGHHDFTGFWAAIWPLLIDTFIAVGELAVFVAMVDRWLLSYRVSAWLVTGLGLAGSVAANIGHVVTHDIASRATAAVPPLAAATSLWVGMGVLKRVVSGSAGTTAMMTGSPRPTASPDSGPNFTSGGAPGGRSYGGLKQPREQKHSSWAESSARERAKRVIAADPGLANADVAKRSGASERTITRARQDLARAAGDSTNGSNL